jgi:ABC-2 type transport system ATP-binding protein
MNAIRIEALAKRYRAVTALDGLDLAVEAGTVFGFLGPNGAGKTTAIRILTGLARADAGRAWIAGVEVSSGPSTVARHIGHLPEEPAFYGWMTPQEFLMHVGGLFDMPASDSRARAAELLALVGLAEVARRRIAGFSRGMRQRLGLAQALMNRPSVLLLDEPVSALDPAGRKEVLELIDLLRGECTVLMSSHILADVERVCDAVGIIARGRLVAQAPRAELLSRYALPVFELEALPDFETALRAWAEAERQRPWVTGATTSGASVRLTVSDVAAAQQALLASAVQAGLGLARYEIVRPSLEDIFLSLVAEGAQP